MSTASEACCISGVEAAEFGGKHAKRPVHFEAPQKLLGRLRLVGAGGRIDDLDGRQQRARFQEQQPRRHRQEL